jgi:hypothetical protein
VFNPNRASVGVFSAVQAQSSVTQAEFTGLGSQTHSSWYAEDMRIGGGRTALKQQPDILQYQGHYGGAVAVARNPVLMDIEPAFSTLMQAQLQKLLLYGFPRTIFFMKFHKILENTGAHQ